MTAGFLIETACSLYDEAVHEAERHKWIESEKLGHDAGFSAIEEWYRTHWRDYCRHCRLEHLQGERPWREFEAEHFGQLYDLLLLGDLLVDRILDRVYAGYENLEILVWAVDWGLSLERVVEVLSQIDVNRARLDPAL